MRTRVARHVVPALVVAASAGLLSVCVASALRQDKGMADMQMSAGVSSNGSPCAAMGSDAGSMSVMGQSMAAMTNHMCITPQFPKQPGDDARAKAVVDQVRAAIEKYKDYKKAIADGYAIANPDVKEPQYHFTNEANVKVQDAGFDPTRPTSLLYFSTPTQRYKLEGVMFTDKPGASYEELNSRIPLSVARWHEHANFCAAPADKTKEYLGAHPKFGMFGSIHTKAECDKAGGQFLPYVFSWMIHVFPYEDNLKDQFAMNDDVPHVK